MSTWADVSKGDRIELKGRAYRVAKIKPKGKRAKVTVEAGGGSFTSEVRLKDAVTIVRDEPRRRERERPLHDRQGRQTRWATQAEHDEATKPRVPRGNPKATRPPSPPGADPWEQPRDRIERKLDKLLGAHLVGEAADESAGYYVPPVGVDTIAAHLALFHGVDPSPYGVDDMLELHGTQHLAALGGQALTVNHWHTETRPEPAP